jgi:hypothetical protein
MNESKTGTIRDAMGAWNRTIERLHLLRELAESGNVIENPIAFRELAVHAAGDALNDLEAYKADLTEAGVIVINGDGYEIDLKWR